MDVQQKLLVIADIGGYTRYMLATRMSLAHAQLAVSGLIEAVLDGAGVLQLAKLEGDAAFLQAPANKRDCLSADIARMRNRFVEKKRALIAARLCNCEGCKSLEDLTLKFVAHEGEVAIHKIRQLEELAGIDVILVHRMLKNDVPVKEYLLVTDPVLGCLDEHTRRRAQPLQHDFEGIGATATHYVDVNELDASQALAKPPLAMGLLARLVAKVRQELRALPYLLGIKEPTAGFHNLEGQVDSKVDPR